MKIAFIILSCDYPGNHFTRLLERLAEFEDSVIYIHHDFNQNDFDKSLLNRFNIVMAKNNYVTYWSHINNVKATWDLIKQANEECKPDWTITLTPTCYPIKSISQIENFLKESEYDGYMSHRKVTSTPVWELDQWIYRDMYHRKIVIPIINRPIFIKRRKSKVPFDDSFPIWHGSNYFMLNNKAVSELLSQEDTYRRLVNFYEGIKSTEQHPCPQEIVLQSIIINNCKTLKINNDYYRFTKWVNGVWSPIYLTEANFDEIRDSNSLFARKFRSPESDELVKLIDNMTQKRN